MTIPNHRPARFQISFKFGEINKAVGSAGEAYTYWQEKMVPQLQSIYPQGDYSELGAINYNEIDPLTYDLLLMFFKGWIFGVIDWADESGSWIYLDAEPLAPGLFPNDLKVS